MPYHLVFSNQVTVYILLVQVLFGSRIFYEQVLKILQLYLQSIVVVAYDHVVFLGHFSSVTDLLILLLQAGHLELVLLHYLIERDLDLSSLYSSISSCLFALLHFRNA